MNLIATGIISLLLTVASVLFVAWQPFGQKIHKKYFGFKPFSCYICLPIWVTGASLLINWLCGASGYSFGFILLPLFLSKYIYKKLP